ncbi:MAG: VWA domain-containing protein, partial [Candidatus Poribacteria bacterium]|nr:VWA domain-containing protein [Candidatus Poribacteria bacterium]
LESMEEAVDGLIDSIGRRDRVAIIKFSRRVSIDLVLTTDRTAINAAVHAPHTDNQGSMVLYDAISAAIQLLRDTAGLKSIVVLTDGEDSGSQVSSEQIIGAASGHNIAIYTIGLGENLDSESLTQIADSTSGRFFAASDSDVLHDIYREIFHALNSSYVLTYQSQASRVKGVSLLAVEVTHAKAFARDMVPLPSPS